MRYIYSILLIAVVFTLVTGGIILHKKEEKPDPGLMINDRVISTSEFAELYRNSHQGQEASEQFMEALITRELLIQEAMKMGIDRDETFRRSIQNFYEQSLTKLLLEKKADAFAYNPSKQEIGRLLDRQNYLVELTLLSASEPSGAAIQHKGLFRNLASAMQVAVIPVEVGDKSAPILLNGVEQIIRLDRLSRVEADDSPPMTSDEARQTIINDHREQSLARWIYDLRQQATVKISDALVKQQATGNPEKKRSAL